MSPLVLLFLTLLNANTWPPVAGRRPTVWSGPRWWWWEGDGWDVMSPVCTAGLLSVVAVFVGVCMCVCILACVF